MLIIKIKNKIMVFIWNNSLITIYQMDKRLMFNKWIYHVQICYLNQNNLTLILKEFMKQQLNVYKDLIQNYLKHCKISNISSFDNIIISGGTSMTSGFIERLN